MYLLNAETEISWVIGATTTVIALNDLDVITINPEGIEVYLSSVIAVEDYVAPSEFVDGSAAYTFTPNMEGLWKVKLVTGDVGSYAEWSSVEMQVLDSASSTNPAAAYIRTQVTSDSIKVPCNTATTANITLSGLDAIATYTATIGERILVKDQTDLTQNGIYNAAIGSWTRATDFDNDQDAVNGVIVVDNSLHVIYNANYTGALNIGTTEITFEAVATTLDPLATVLENLEYTKEWARKAEDSHVSVAAGGGVAADDYSAFHFAAKAFSDATDTAADLVLTNADVVKTNADVVITNADVVLTNTKYKLFDDRYLGEFADAPSTLNDLATVLDASHEGIEYWDSSIGTRMNWNGTSWGRTDAMTATTANAVTVADINTNFEHNDLELVLNEIGSGLNSGLRNGSFEDNLTNWTEVITAGGTIAINATTASSGRKSFQVGIPVAGDIVEITSDIFDIPSNKNLRIFCDMKINLSGNQAVSVGVTLYDESDGSPAYHIMSAPTAITTTSWSGNEYLLEAATVSSKTRASITFIFSHLIDGSLSYIDNIRRELDSNKTYVGVVTSGVADDYVIRTNPEIDVLVPGDSFEFVPNISNSGGAATLDVGTGVPKDIRLRNSGPALAANYITASHRAKVYFDGAYFLLDNVPAIAITTDCAQTLTNKSLTAPTLTGTTLNNGIIWGGTYDGTINFNGATTISGTPVINSPTIYTPTLSAPTLTGTTTNSGTISGGNLSGAIGASGATITAPTIVNAGMTNQIATGGSLTNGTLNSCSHNGSTIINNGHQSVGSGNWANWSTIPSWVNRITITLENIRIASGSGLLELRAGYDLGIVTTGYFGNRLLTSTVSAAKTDYWAVSSGYEAASNATYGVLYLDKLGSANIWTLSGGTYTHGAFTSCATFGRVSMAGVLTQVQINANVSTFSAGSWSISYE